jgi:glycogen debranching enzyme
MIDAVLSAEGWPYASAPPIEPGDPGRYHALFGRDSLITALQLLPVRPEIARATLRALAERQGVRDDPLTGEQPGKIGHEFRDAAPASLDWPQPGPFRYYGTADATAWFIVLASRVGGFNDAVAGAAGWLDRSLDGGLLRHSPGEHGLSQQGWRDTIDAAADPDGGGFVRADGTNPAPPLADADTQAVVVAALRALGRDVRDTVRVISERFGPEVMALEAGDVAVPGAGSQLGWLLWADALDPDASAAAAARLCEPDILTPYGLRTLAVGRPGFRVDAYHRGSVWPFDSWLGWGGLRAAGRLEEAERVRVGVLEALDRLGNAHELYAVTLDGELQPLATSNRLQAWSIGARWALENEWDARARAVPPGS